jgi:hypothetical protein
MRPLCVGGRKARVKVSRPLARNDIHLEDSMRRYGYLVFALSLVPGLTFLCEGQPSEAQVAPYARRAASNPLAPPIIPEQQQPEYQIAVESALVVLDVLVTDEDGNVLSGLKRVNFRVLDDGKPQVITTFGPTEDPITIVILLEYSGLAYDYFAYKGAYWSTGFLNHLDPKDWVALMTYDMKPTIRVDFTQQSRSAGCSQQSVPSWLY